MSRSIESTAETLRAEASWLRSLADRMESLANEMAPHKAQGIEQEAAESEESEPAKELAIIPEIIPESNGHAPPAILPTLLQSPPMEFSGLTQKNAILKALQTYGPQSTGELWTRLTQAGMPGITRQQLAVAVCNIKRKRGIIRDDDGKNRILQVLTKAC